MSHLSAYTFLNKANITVLYWNGPILTLPYRSRIYYGYMPSPEAFCPILWGSSILLFVKWVHIYDAFLFYIATKFIILLQELERESISACFFMIFDGWHCCTAAWPLLAMAQSHFRHALPKCLAADGVIDDWAMRFDTTAYLQVQVTW